MIIFIYLKDNLIPFLSNIKYKQLWNNLHSWNIITIDFQYCIVNQLIIQVAPKKSDIFSSCVIRGEERPVWDLTVDACDEVFKEVLTAEGLCYTFNTLSEEDMFYTDKYDYMIMIITYELI